ncbi:hypothetical protein KJY77_03555 [Canibacter sp. lx-72]|uniref:hypothetical protein n=1 Tax=Canibacter zhuwentaonis TaxID=2837491 RepID=UPI001BDCEA77|nr:hypothetical protein [Canibacter zhuwentaonis]MBT1018214.1 hypothetical protein [Canibacter zhuwentaonis]
MCATLRRSTADAVDTACAVCEMAADADTADALLAAGRSKRRRLWFADEINS